MAERGMTADRVTPPPTAAEAHPVTRRLLRWDASAAGMLFASTAVLAVVGYEQAAYVTLLGGAGCASLAATMMFRLMRLSRTPS